MDDIIQNIQDLFISRYDTYAVQKQTGYIRLDEELTDDIIKNHLDGKITIGCYQFNKENKLKWLCFDFDGEDLGMQFQEAKRFYLYLKDNLKVESTILEFSGKKGYHVWIFCEETDGISALEWGKEVSKDFSVHEIFPKQTSIGDKYGNLVKLPLGIHVISGKRTTFFDDDFNELTLKNSFKLLKNIQRKKLTIPKVIIKEIVRTIYTNIPKQELPVYINHLIKFGVKEGERHKNRFIIIKEMYNAGYSQEEIIRNVLAFNKNCSPPENEFIVENHIRRLLQYPERYLAKEIETDLITLEELKGIGDIDYNLVINTYKKWMYIEDTSPIDLSLAVALLRKQPLMPIWIIFIAPSGSGKTELLKPFEDKNNPSTTEIMSKITKNTFLSGIKKEVDFGERLVNNPTLFLTFDFAQFIKLNSEEKSQIWAELRDLYDGFLERKSAFNTCKKITDIKVNWLICSTPIVDSEILIHQELGTRELLFRFKKEEKENELMNKIWSNLDKLHEMRKELNFIVRKFIEKREMKGFKNIEIKEEIKKELMNLAMMIASLRASTESDNYTGELTNFVYKELPTRILLQLKTLYLGLKNIDEDYPDEKALSILKKIALSSVHPVRLKIILTIISSVDKLSTTSIQKKLSIGWKTIITQLYTARQLGLVEFEEDPYQNEEKEWKRKYWFVTTNPLIEYIKENFQDGEEMKGLTFG
jgi:hypothetical protein